MDREKVQRDFDELARLAGGHSGSDRYDSFLLKLIPAEVKSVLEIGCGSGRFTKLLAADNRKVTAIDLSPEMIAMARESVDNSSVTFLCKDFFEEDFAGHTFDCVISSATLHHMSFDTAVPRMKELLSSDGTLIIHDLRSNDGGVDTARSYTAFAYDSCRRFLQTGRARQPRVVREFWQRHAAGETYLTVKEATELADRWLPGARVVDHSLWRYTIEWKKDEE